MAIARLAQLVGMFREELPPEHAAWGAQGAEAAEALQGRFLRPARALPRPRLLDLEEALVDLGTVEACLESRNPHDREAEEEMNRLEIALQHLATACRPRAGLPADA